jgi:tetratricopeptide (TPR) repeat protein
LYAARICELEENWEKAIDHYQRAIDLGERSPQVLRRVAQLLFERQRYLEADRAIRMLGDLPHDTSSVGALRLATELSLWSRDVERALTLARRAVATESDDYRDHVWLGQVLWAAGKPQEAHAALQRAVEMANGAPGPWVALIQFLANSGQRRSAEAAIEDASNQLTGDQAPLALAQCYEAIGQRERAEEQYLLATAGSSAKAASLRAAAEFYLRSGDPENAEPLLRRIVEQAGDAASAQDITWARHTLATVLASKADTKTFHQALALINSNAPQAGESLAERRAKAALLATRRSRRERLEAVGTLEEVARVRALAASEQFLLARLYESLGDEPKARRYMADLVRSLEEAAKLRPPTAADTFLMAQLSEMAGDWPKARDLMRRYASVTDPDPYYLAIYAREQLRRDGAEIETDFLVRKLEGLVPGTAQALEMRIRLLVQRSEVEPAIQLLREAAENEQILSTDRADRLRWATALVDELIEQCRANGHRSMVESLTEQAEVLYRKLADTSNDGVLPLIAFLTRHKRIDEALSVCEGAWNRLPPDTVAPASVAVLQSGQAGGEHCERVARLLEASLGKQPHSRAVALSLAMVRDEQGRYEEAERLYRRTLEIHAHDVAALNNRAWLLAHGLGDAQEAVELVNRAIDIAGPIAELLDTRATVYLALGDTQRAIADLEESLADAPTGVSYFHLAQAYFGTGELDAARSAFERGKLVGLTDSDIHPLEQAAFRDLASKLDPPSE